MRGRRGRRKREGKTEEGADRGGRLRGEDYG